MAYRPAASGSIKPIKPQKPISQHIQSRPGIRPSAGVKPVIRSR